MILQLSFARFTLDEFFATYRTHAMLCAARIAPSLSMDCLASNIGTAIYTSWNEMLTNKSNAQEQSEGWVVKFIALNLLNLLKRDLREMKHLAIIATNDLAHESDDTDPCFDIEDSFTVYQLSTEDNLDYLPHAKDTKLADVRMDLEQAIQLVAEQCKAHPARLRHLNDIVLGKPDNTPTCKIVLDMLAEALANYKPEDNKPRRRTKVFNQPPTAKVKYENDIPKLKQALFTLDKQQLGKLHAMIQASPSAEHDTIIFGHILAKTPQRQVTKETGIQSGQIWQCIRRISLLGAKVRGEEVCDLKNTYSVESAMKRLQKSPTPELMVALMKTAKDTVESAKRYSNPNCERVKSIRKQLAVLSVIMYDIPTEDKLRLANVTLAEYKTARYYVMARLKKHITLA